MALLVWFGGGLLMVGTLAVGVYRGVAAYGRFLCALGRAMGVYDPAVEADRHVGDEFGGLEPVLPGEKATR